MKQGRWWAAWIVVWAFGIGQAGAQEVPASGEVVDTEPAEPEAAVHAGYDGGFFIQSAEGDYRLALTGLVQPHFQAVFPEAGDNQAAFRIRRGRLGFRGHAISPDLTFKFDTEFGRGNVSLLDYYANYAFGEGLQLRLGQWKRPFSRQFIGSSSRMELVDQAPVDDFFDADRDIGLAIHNGYERSPDFEWALGVFNGTGVGSRFSADVRVDPATGEGEVTRARTTNVPDVFHPAVVFRVGINTGGIRGYSEGDLEGGGPRLALALSGRADFDANNDDASAFRGEVDFSFKASGFGATGAVYAASFQDGEGMGDQVFQGWGGYLQVGYVFAERWQPVARYAVVAPDGEGSEQEAVIGFNWFFVGHDFKWQTDGGLLSAEDEAGAETQDVRVRSQVTLAF